MGQAELGAKKQQEIFKALGVDYHATATVAIPQLADGLAKIGNDSKRHALEVATMGRAAVALETLEPTRGQMEGGKPSFQAPSESPTDALPSARAPSP